MDYISILLDGLFKSRVLTPYVWSESYCNCGLIYTYELGVSPLGTSTALVYCSFAHQGKRMDVPGTLQRRRAGIINASVTRAPTVCTLRSLLEVERRHASLQSSLLRRLVDFKASRPIDPVRIKQLQPQASSRHPRCKENGAPNWRRLEAIVKHSPLRPRHLPVAKGSSILHQTTSAKVPAIDETFLPADLIMSNADAKQPQVQQDARELVDKYPKYSELELCCVCGDWADHCHNREVILLCSNKNCARGMDVFGTPAPSAIHIMCLDPKLESVPLWDWFCCADCKSQF